VISTPACSTKSHRAGFLDKHGHGLVAKVHGNNACDGSSPRLQPYDMMYRRPSNYEWKMLDTCKLMAFKVTYLSTARVTLVRFSTTFDAHIVSPEPRNVREISTCCFSSLFVRVDSQDAIAGNTPYVEFL